jgi:hypothetical protein
MKKIYKILNSIYLCLRFPFLYPRNRFTGKHHVSPDWLLKLTNKYHRKAYTNISLGYRFYKDPKECTETNTVVEHVGKYDFKVSLISNSILKFESKYIESPIEFNLQKHVGNIFTITGITISENRFTGNPFIIYHIHKNEVVNDNYGFSFKTFDLCVSRYNEKIYNFIRYVWDNIIDRICFIPSYTELDAMPDGWRKAFGIQMCKDLKKVLKQYNYLYKYRIMQIKEKYGCYDEKTEILTLNGWKYFKDLNDGEIVATLNPKTHVLEYQKITDKISYNYDGKMYRLKNRGIDLLVTPNHNLYVAKGSYYNGNKNNKKREYNLELTTPDTYFGKDKRFLKGCYWEGLNLQDNFKVPDYHKDVLRSQNNPELGTRHYVHIGPEMPMKAFLKFLGFYVAEGYCNYRQGLGSEIILAYNPQDELELVTTLVKDIGFIPRFSKGACRFSNLALGIWLRENCGHGALNKKVPGFIKSLPSEYIKIFLDYLFIGDGHKTKTSNILTTISTQLRDDVCELLLKVGCCFSYYSKSAEYINNLKKNKNYQYQITSKHTAWYINWLQQINVEFDTSKIKKGLCPNTKEEWINYQGKVYCVTVPNHIVYIRRNGKGVWCGNSLRWYSNGSPNGCEYPIISKYEILSERTCIVCGKPAKYRSTGWISPYCEEHAPEGSKELKL